MIKKAIMLLIISTVITAGMAQTVLATPHVGNISLKKQGEFVELTIYADGPFTFTHSIEEAKAGKPYRVIVDLRQCLHQLPQFNFRELPTGVITAIRTSQYTIKPDKVVRIVADVSRPVTYTLKQGEGRIILVFAAPEEKEFEFWCAAPLSEAEKIKLALSDAKTAPVNQPKLMPAEPESEKLAEQAGRFAPPPSANQDVAGEKLVINEHPPAAKPEPGTDPGKPEAKSGLSTDERPDLKQKLAQVFENSEEPAPVVWDQSTPQNQPAVKTEPKKPEPSRLAAGEDQKDSGRPSLLKQNKAAENNALPPTPVDKKTLSDSQAVTPLEPQEDSVEEGATAAPLKPETPADQEGEGKPTEWKSEKELRQNPDRPPKVSGSLAAAFPQREIIRYRTYGRRDPFMPLVAKSLSGFQRGELPDVEALRLVGVLMGDYATMALLEDMEGYGYILETGDEVKNGYVIEIYENKILFQLNEFGWSRSVALSMDIED